MSTSTFSTITEGIRVSVRASYVQDESSPRHQYFVFAYQVEIVNESPYAVQLISREWHIVDSIGGKRKVEGKGVIGQQPILEPGQSHRYVSGSHFFTPIGRMSGYYHMKRLQDGLGLKVQIPPFTMATPYAQN